MMQTIETTEVLPLKGSCNTRDLGGYPAAGGKKVRRGVCLRSDSLELLEFLDKNLPKDSFLLSLMSQYTPQSGAEGVLARRVSAAEYRAAVQYMRDCGIEDGFSQQRESAEASYTPDFSLQGVLKGEEA